MGKSNVAQELIRNALRLQQKALSVMHLGKYSFHTGDFLENSVEVSTFLMQLLARYTGKICV